MQQLLYTINSVFSSKCYIGIPTKLIVSDPNMAHCKQQVKARRHLVFDHCHSLDLVDFICSGCEVFGRDNAGRFYFSVRGVLQGGLSNTRDS